MAFPASGVRSIIWHSAIFIIFWRKEKNFIKKEKKKEKKGKKKKNKFLKKPRHAVQGKVDVENQSCTIWGQRLQHQTSLAATWGLLQI